MFLGVVSSEVRNLLQEGEEVVEHVEAVINYIEAEETIGVISHNIFAVKLVQRGQISIPTQVYYPYFVVGVCGEYHLSYVVLIWVEYVSPHPFICDREIQSNLLKRFE